MDPWLREPASLRRAPSLQDSVRGRDATFDAMGCAARRAQLSGEAATSNSSHHSACNAHQCFLGPAIVEEGRGHGFKESNVLA